MEAEMKQGMLEPYVNFDGNTLDAFNFYGEIFQAVPEVLLFDDLPEEERESMGYPEGVMHASLDLGNAHLMGSDTMGNIVNEGNRFYLSWASENVSDVIEVWEKFVEHGAKIIMPLEETFWAEKYGILEDRYGVQWMIQKYSAYPQE
jgi:PhnB protein